MSSRGFALGSPKCLISMERVFVINRGLDFHSTSPLEQSTLPLNRDSTSFSFGVICSTFEDSIDMGLEYDSDTMLDEHDSL